MPSAKASNAVMKFVFAATLVVVLFVVSLLILLAAPTIEIALLGFLVLFGICYPLREWVIAEWKEIML